MADEVGDAVPEGAAVFPLIPPELGVNPLLLAVLHAIVFLDGSAKEIVEPSAAEEARGHMAEYLQRLRGAQMQQIVEDMKCLAGYARHAKWPKQQQLFIKEFLQDYGIGEDTA